MDPDAVLNRHCPPGTRARQVLAAHGRDVADLALFLARRMDNGIDLEFVREAALLHDIGMVRTKAPALGCHGPHPYILHGVLGRKMLEAEGLPAHARVCETHVGTGISAAEVTARGLPLPARDMLPETLEEKLVCYADKFFSKGGPGGPGRKTVVRAEQELAALSPEKAAAFRHLLHLFGPPPW